MMGLQPGCVYKTLQLLQSVSAVERLCSSNEHNAESGADCAAWLTGVGHIRVPAAVSMLGCPILLLLLRGWHSGWGAHRATHAPTSAKAPFTCRRSLSHAQIADANRTSDAYSWHVTSVRFTVARDRSSSVEYWYSR